MDLRCVSFESPMSIIPSQLHVYRFSDLDCQVTRFQSVDMEWRNDYPLSSLWRQVILPRLSLAEVSSRTGLFGCSFLHCYCYPDILMIPVGLFSFEYAPGRCIVLSYITSSNAGDDSLMASPPGPLGWYPWTYKNALVFTRLTEGL